MAADERTFEVLRAIRRIIRAVSMHSKTLARDSGMTLPQLMCLKAVAELDADEVTVSQVAQRVQLSPATTSRIIDRLTRAGLVERQRSARDRRRVSLSLSETGRARYDTLPAPLQDRFVERYAALPAEERDRLLEALTELTRMLEAEDVDASPLLAPDID